MIRFRFAADDLLRTRFAISPLFELTGAHAALRDPAGRSLHLPWIRAARRRTAELATPLLDALVPLRGYTPDFISPPPDGPLPEPEAELRRVARTPAAQVRTELGWRFEPAAPPVVLRPLHDDPSRGLRPLVAEMQAFWEAALAPDWDRVRATLEDDIAHRARALTAGGPIEVFGDLHPDVRWEAEGLAVRLTYEATVELGGRGLQLVPAVFVWPRVTAMTDPPWQPSLIYPPRGVGALWEPPRRDDGALAALLGARRAKLLDALDHETSTTTLARRLGASPAGVSEHLAVLRRAGVVRARRHGREVLYARTASGDALLRAPGAPGHP